MVQSSFHRRSIFFSRRGCGRRLNFSGLKPRRIFWNWEMSRAFHRLQPDCFFSTYYSEPPGIVSQEIVFFYDMIDEIFYKISWSDHALVIRKTRWRTGLAQSLRFQTKPKKISCLSTNTCRRNRTSKYCTWLQPKSSKPPVIGEFSRSVSPRPFILTVGKRFRYKNFLTLLKASAGNSEF